MESLRQHRDASTLSTNLLTQSRCYLSGPMDFVGSRVIEKYFGWRAILTPILKTLDITVFDPWNKPSIRGRDDYGKEGVQHSSQAYDKDFWTNDETRARFEQDFWPTVHIDLRMTDLADFLIAFVPTNIYSVGTVHEIVMARDQHKPVLIVSPPVTYDLFPELARLPEDAKEALKYYGLKENPQGIPSNWYGTIIGGQYLFDGFGWEALNFKADDFYSSLIEEVLRCSQPDPADEQAHADWRHVRDWVDHQAPLTRLAGGLLDQLPSLADDERAILQQEMEKPAERQRTHFWYNQAYTPKRPLLYQLLKIASGLLPTRTNIAPQLNAAGDIVYERTTSVDDNWLLLHPS